MSSDQIVSALWRHDPGFVEFSRNVLGADSAEEAWEMLYAPGGVSKMSPEPSEVHVLGTAKLRRTGRRKQEIAKFDPLKIGQAAFPGLERTVAHHGIRASGKQARKAAKLQVKNAKAQAKLQVKAAKQNVKLTPKKLQSPPGAPAPAAAAAPPVAPPTPPAAPKPRKWLKRTVIGGTAVATAAGGVALANKGKQSVRGYDQYPGDLEERARQEQMALGKSYEFTQEFDIVKSDDKRQVFGWASVIEKDGQPVLDKQGDIISPEEMENSAYKFVIQSRKGGRQHKRTDDGDVVHVSDMIESMAFTKDKIEKLGLPEETPVGWWVGFKVNDDDTWRAVKNGEVTSFSIHGRGKRVPVE